MLSMHENSLKIIMKYKKIVSHTNLSDIEIRIRKYINYSLDLVKIVTLCHFI